MSTRTCSASAFQPTSTLNIPAFPLNSPSSKGSKLHTMELNNPGGFRSRRSYPNLHHVSLAPLTPRFPIDDDTEPTDYFSPRDTLDNSNSGTKTPPRTSYFSSVSVPSTPPILSHSRSTSRTRHHRSKSSSRAATFSDSNLHSRDISLPLHHQHLHKKTTSFSPHVRRHGEHHHNHGHGQSHTSKSDAEWMLRAGIALASSTREEKGQSWLSKRESSTSLISDFPIDGVTDPTTPHRHHRRTKSGSSRKSRSGASTPAGPSLSRRSSRSRGGSRRGSRAGLTMTSMSISSAGPGKISGTISPEDRGRSSVSGSGSGSVSGTGVGVEPDFVDERIRAEIASLRDQEDRGDFEGDGVVDYGDEDEFWDGDEYGDDGSEYDYSTDETHDEFDEADLQRLTRERGFGLGSWIDRLVEWTLFGVEDWPALTPASASNATRIGTTPTTTTVTFEEPPTDQSERDNGGDELLEGDDDFDTVSVADDEVAEVGKPGSQGGWEDVGWLFRAVKRAII